VFYKIKVEDLVLYTKNHLPFLSSCSFQTQPLQEFAAARQFLKSENGKIVFCWNTICKAFEMGFGKYKDL